MLIERGASYVSLYNVWLNFKAARDLAEYGLVEHIDFEKVIEKQEGLKLIHKERKNMGMTYLFILENDK